MNKPLFLFVGRSASGKTSIAELLEEKYYYRQVYSYTTRAPRFKDEPGHIFVSEEAFKDLGEMVAYTYYNSSHYGTTAAQLDECDIYVVDIPGVKTLLDRYRKDRPIHIIYFDASTYTRICRMIDRHDSDAVIISRLLHDEEEDWYDQVHKIVWHYANNENRDVTLFKVNANEHKTEVFNQVASYIESNITMEA